MKDWTQTEIAKIIETQNRITSELNAEKPKPRSRDVQKFFPKNCEIFSSHSNAYNSEDSQPSPQKEIYHDNAKTTIEEKPKYDKKELEREMKSWLLFLYHHNGQKNRTQEVICKECEKKKTKWCNNCKQKGKCSTELIGLKLILRTKEKQHYANSKERKKLYHAFLSYRKAYLQSVREKPKFKIFKEKPIEKSPLDIIFNDNWNTILNKYPDIKLLTQQFLIEKKKDWITEYNEDSKHYGKESPMQHLKGDIGKKCREDNDTRTASLDGQIVSYGNGKNEKLNEALIAQNKEPIDWIHYWKQNISEYTNIKHESEIMKLRMRVITKMTSKAEREIMLGLTRSVRKYWVGILHRKRKQTKIEFQISQNKDNEMVITKIKKRIEYPIEPQSLSYWRKTKKIIVCKDGKLFVSIKDF